MNTKKYFWAFAGIVIYLAMVWIFPPPNFHSAILLAANKLDATAFTGYLFRSENFFPDFVILYSQKFSILILHVVSFVEIALLIRSNVNRRIWLFWYSIIIVRTPLNIGIQIIVSSLILSWLAIRAGFNENLLQKSLIEPRMGKKLLYSLMTTTILCSIFASGVMVLNPAGIIQRVRVMKNYENLGFIAHSVATKVLQVDADCTWVTEVRDLYTRNLLEEIQLKTLWNAKKIILLDLKLVEANLTLLKIKNQSNEYVFGEAAVTYAEAEKKYAHTIRAELEKSDHVCFVSHFSIFPEEETYPFSRTREILDERKKLGKRTTIYNF